MNYKVDLTDYFARQLKRMIKKYPSLKNEVLQLVESLEINPQQGKRLLQDSIINCIKR